MNEIQRRPELEACGWYVRTKRTDTAPEGWLVADCSSSPHGAEYARRFAAVHELYEVVELIDRHGVASPMVMEKAKAALAKANGA
jgi:hypothetical protein